jgi:CRISPR-associated protein Cas1
MRMHMNVLYVMTQGASVLKEGETLVVRVEQEQRLRVPVHTLAAVVTFGRVWCSPPMLGFCAERGVSVAFLTEQGRFLARVEGGASGNVVLRRTQYRLADSDETTARIARSVVIGKIANSRTVLLRAGRDAAAGPRQAALVGAADHLARILDGLRDGLPLDVVRGHEGDAARKYFDVFDTLVLREEEEFRFRGRSRRPPLDRVNAVLSFVYALLLSDVKAALESVGLDPQVGFLHRDRPGRSGLALDLMEEHRGWLADRLVLSLVNRKQLDPSDFRIEPTGGILLEDEARKKVLKAYQERKADEVQHPFLAEKMPIAVLLHMQARLFAKHLRGDIDAYPPFLWR